MQNIRGSLWLAVRHAVATTAIAGWTFICAPVVLAGPDASERPGLAAVHVPDDKPARSTAILLSGADGWTLALDARAARLAKFNTLVIGIDTAALLTDAKGSCRQAADRLLPMARDLSQQAGAAPRHPVLVGMDTGGYLALATASRHAGQVKALITEAFGTRPGPCQAMADPDLIGPKAPVRWLDVERPGTRSPASVLRGTKVVPARDDAAKAFFRSYLGVAGADHAYDIRTGTTEQALSHLPLTIHTDPSSPPTDTFAIFLSGDGGWANFDEQISIRLAAAGVPVIGISTLRYLWRERRPAQIAQDVGAIYDHYALRFGRRKILLIGFSLGANVTPFYVPELPLRVRDQIARIGLIAPERQTGFEIVIGGWLGRATGSEDVAPAITALDGVVDGSRVRCLHGTTETVSACPDTTLPGMIPSLFEGGHHLGNDYDAIAGDLLQLVPEHPTIGAIAGKGEGN